MYSEIPALAAGDTPARIIESYRRSIEEALRELVSSDELSELYEPVNHVLEGGGKRLRPILVLLAARLYGVEDLDAMPGALAVEVFHNFTLVHDDIMDHAPERRGRPTVHVRWDESTAILTGDYLLALSYELLARLNRGDLRQIVRTYHRMVTLLCEGQALDKAFEQRTDVTVNDYFSMIYAKTGALIEACLELGGLIGGAPADEIERLRAIGRDIGRAFQIQDDLLDLMATDERWGKSIGSDLIEGKKTFLLLRAIERAESDDRRFFEHIVRRPGLPAVQINEARERMQRLGVIDEAEQAVHRHSEAALKALATLSEGEAAQSLVWLVDRMRQRAH